MLPAQPNRSLIDGMTVLQAVIGAGEDVGVRELARELGLENTRVHRLLRTFVHLGMLGRTEAGRYRPGPGIHVLAAQSLFGSKLIQRALPILERLAGYGHTVALGVLWRDQTSYLYHAQPHTRPTEALGRAGLYPATRSSIGLMLLAKQPADQVAALYQDRTILGMPAGLPGLVEKLNAVRRDGFALVDERPDGSRRSLAVPVGEPAYAAVALAGGITKADAPGLVTALREAADAIAHDTVPVKQA